MKAKKDLHNRRWIRARLLIIGVCFALFFAALLARAVDLQILDQERLQGLAQREFMRRAKLAPRRGIIYDRNQQELAVSLDTDSVYASPVKITDPASTARKLAKVLGQPYRKVRANLKGEKGFRWLQRRIPPEKAQAINQLDLKGIGLVKEPRRFYPFTTLACHVLGFSGLDARGLEGLEKYYDKTLKGDSPTVTSLRDNLGRTIHLTPAAFTTLPEGHHLILTLDKRLQYQVEKVLAATVSRYRAQAGQAVVLIPQTGEILAMASWPVFNPNVFSEYPSQAFRNRNVTDAFEPGSTFKIFAAASALQNGKVALDQLFDCENGTWTVGGRTIHDTHKYDLLNLADIVKYSSNIGAAKVGQALGAKTLAMTIKAFGFGRHSGVDLPGESRGILRPASTWRPVELANICFGQGVAVTPLQLTSAVAAIANGGVLMRPFVVRAEIDQHARLIRETQPQARGRALGARQARLLTEMMVRVTQKGGTGTKARLEPFPVAGKTGTAQKTKPGGGYSHKDFISSFVGFAPADNPKVAVLVVIDTPRGAIYGGDVAAPAWSLITRAALEARGMYRTAPPILEAKTDAPPVAALSVSQKNLVPSQAISHGLTPDFRGMTLRQVLRLCAQGRVQVSAKGWGRVIDQLPNPGAALKGRLSLRLRPAGEGV
ncbi:MAG: penicillin-binding transpeptidase domain-containing protein [Desulfarculaceae bacterium]